MPSDFATTVSFKQIHLHFIRTLSKSKGRVPILASSSIHDCCTPFRNRISLNVWKFHWPEPTDPQQGHAASKLPLFS